MVVYHLGVILLVWVASTSTGMFCARLQFGGWWWLWSPLLSVLVGVFIALVGLPLYGRDLAGTLYAYGNAILSGILPFVGALLIPKIWNYLPKT